MSFAVTRGRITSHDVNQSKRDKSATELSSKPLKAISEGQHARPATIGYSHFADQIEALFSPARGAQSLTSEVRSWLSIVIRKE